MKHKTCVSITEKNPNKLNSVLKKDNLCLTTFLESCALLLSLLINSFFDGGNIKILITFRDLYFIFQAMYLLICSLEEKDYFYPNTMFVLQ